MINHISMWCRLSGSAHCSGFVRGILRTNQLTGNGASWELTFLLMQETQQNNILSSVMETYDIENQEGRQGVNFQEQFVIEGPCQNSRPKRLFCHPHGLSKFNVTPIEKNVSSEALKGNIISILIFGKK